MTDAQRYKRMKIAKCKVRIREMMVNRSATIEKWRRSANLTLVSTHTSPFSTAYAIGTVEEFEDHEFSVSYVVRKSLDITISI